jgi:hypothetical protein
MRRAESGALALAFAFAALAGATQASAQTGSTQSGATQTGVGVIDSATNRAQNAVDSANARNRQIEVQTVAPAGPAEPPPLSAPPPMVQGPPISADAVRLVFDREVYTYPGANRRDPFKPLTGDNLAGPMFEDLTLRMIIHSDVAGQSIAVLADSRRKTYRLRRGESVGNVTIVSITADRVTFAVEDFGVRRTEVLSLKNENQGEGA